jgi:tRNA pseudouridine55 synthase
MPTATTEVTGLLLVDKPAGITSHDAVGVVRRITGERRVGHTGTLDPFATGLLVVLVGRGTRLMPYVDGEPKVYDADIRFGTETTTDDLTGEHTREAPLPTDEAIAEAVARLTGAIEQVPPAFSAKQVGGRRAYVAARRGEALELPPSPVVVHQWDMRARHEQRLTVRITCSGGTYVRALARDLGRLAGSAAHLGALRRLGSGPFSVDQAMTLDALALPGARLRPLREAIPTLPVRRLDAAELGRVVHGNPIPARSEGDRVGLLDDQDTLIAVAVRAGDELRPALVLRDA